MKVKLLNFLDTDVILDRLEREALKIGLTLDEVWDRTPLESRNLIHWRTGKHRPNLLSLQVIQNEINEVLRENYPNAEFEYVA